jgi:hypothetical protein
MEPGGSLPHSQEPATCPYPEPAQSSPCPHPTSWRSVLILPSHLRLGLQVVAFPKVSPPKCCMRLSSFPIRATGPAHGVYTQFNHTLSTRSEFSQRCCWRLKSSAMVISCRRFEGLECLYLQGKSSFFSGLMRWSDRVRWCGSSGGW